MTLFFLVFFLVTGFTNFVFSIIILRQLANSNVKVGFFEIRWQIHKHLKTYKQITKAQKGQVGLPYYGYVSTLAGLIIFGLLTFMSLSQ